MDQLGFWAAHVPEEGTRPIHAGLGGLGVAGLTQRVAQDEQRGGLAEAMPGLAVEGGRLAGMADREVELALVEVDGGDGGERLAFQHLEAGAPGEADGDPPVAASPIGLAGVPVGDGQPDERLRLGIAGPDVAVQGQRLGEVVGGLL